MGTPTVNMKSFIFLYHIGPPQAFLCARCTEESRGACHHYENENDDDGTCPHHTLAVYMQATECDWCSAEQCREGIRFVPPGGREDARTSVCAGGGT